MNELEMFLERTKRNVKGLVLSKGERMRNYEIEMQEDKLKFQEKRIDDLETKVLSQAEEVEKQRLQIEGWIKRASLDPNGKMM